MHFRLECGLSLAKLRSRGWVQIKCFAVGQHLEHCCPADEYCFCAVTFESGKIQRENWWPCVLKVCFCKFDCFKSKTKMQPPKKCFAHLAKNEIRELFVKNCISTLILLINLFCFNNCGLFWLCYTTKHLMTAPSGNICFGSLESKHRGSRETKQMFPSWVVIKCVLW